MTQELSVSKLAATCPEAGSERGGGETAGDYFISPPRYLPLPPSTNVTSGRIKGEA